MKTYKKLQVLVLCGMLTATTASAQTLVLHHSSGSTTDIKLTESTNITISGGDIVVDNVTYGDISRISYKPETLRGDLNGDGSVDVGDIMSIVNIMAAGSSSYTSCPDGNHPHIIDLGLPSGTKWACCNVGASAPEGYGNHYAWGETQAKSVYNWDTYQYGYYNSDYDYSHLVNIGSDIAGTAYDAATVNWGAPWRMPSLTQIKELLSNCTSVWTTQNGVNGRKFTGPNGGTIFLPAAGTRWSGELYDVGSLGYYRSSALYEGNPSGAYGLLFNSGGASWGNIGDDRGDGHSVRPVR